MLIVSECNACGTPLPNVASCTWFRAAPSAICVHSAGEEPFISVPLCDRVWRIPKRDVVARTTRVAVVLVQVEYWATADGAAFAADDNVTCLAPAVPIGTADASAIVGDCAWAIEDAKAGREEARLGLQNEGVAITSIFMRGNLYDVCAQLRHDTCLAHRLCG